MTNPLAPSTPAIWPGGHLVLPPLLDHVVRSLDANLALPPAAGTAFVLQVLSAALGAAAQLVEGAAAPLSAELSAECAMPRPSTMLTASHMTQFPRRQSRWGISKMQNDTL